MIIEFDCLCGGKGFAFNPVHEVPWAFVGGGNFLDLFVEEGIFGLLDGIFVGSLLLNLTCSMVVS